MVTFRFAHPWWLLAALVVVPLVYLSWRPLEAAGKVRRGVSVAIRALGVLVLASVLAEPVLVRVHDRVTVIAVLDRSLSVPEAVADGARTWLQAAAAAGRGPDDRFAVLSVAERAVIERLGGAKATVDERVLSLTGEQTNLAAGVEMALAIAPADTAVRLLVASDGNETAGDLRETVRVAAAGGIPIDVLGLKYRHPREVFLKRLVSPAMATRGQTVALRFVLASTAEARGRLSLSLGDRPVDLDPTSDALAAPLRLKAGTNVKTISLPVGSRGLHEFKAEFIPDDPSQDGLVRNNRASSVTYVEGPGHVLVVDGDGRSAAPLVRALTEAGLEARGRGVGDLPSNLAGLVDTDAVLLANVAATDLSFAQQEMLGHYVRELGGGIVMTGGPQSFGAGGWIGSPLADVLPVDLDPPQKKEMPEGVLVLIIDRSGSMSGRKLQLCKGAAIAAMRTLSRLDTVGVIMFDTRAEWVVPLQRAEDKTAIGRAIRRVPEGGGTDMHPAMVAARNALAGRRGRRHIVLLTDGQTGGPDCRIPAAAMGRAGITISTVAIGQDADGRLLRTIAKLGRGRFYPVRDARLLPQVFIKEALTVKRSLIQEQAFTPAVAASMNPMVRGLEGVPPLDGYVLTAPKGGVAEMLIVGPEDDPVLAAWQTGVGRAVAFTSSTDGRWDGPWAAWGGFGSFWEQAARWVGRSRESPDCVVFADVDGRRVTLTAEAMDSEGNFVQFAGITGRVVTPDMEARTLELVQSGPGQYRAAFTAGPPGSYLASLRYRKAGPEGGTGTVQAVVTIPYATEFRDLEDNVALLAEAARETGGRVLPADPEEADLYSRAGLTLPETPLPVGQWVMMGWVALFLVDVAARRLVVPWAKIAAMPGGVWRRVFVRAERKEDARIAALQSRTRRLRVHMKGRRRDATAARRFEAPEGAAPEMPEAPAVESAAAREPREQAAPEPETPAGTGASHLDRLLDARRRARENR